MIMAWRKQAWHCIDPTMLNVCKWTCETNQHYTKTQIKVNEQLVVRKDIDVNEHDRLYNITYRLKLK
jgi:hypothetical protein